MEYTHKVLDFHKENLSGDFRQAFRYWEALRGRRCCPAWREVDMMTLPLRLVPWCSVVNVVDHGDDFVLRFFGTARVRMQGRDYTGHSVRDMLSNRVVVKTFAELHEVLRQAQPVLHRTTVSTTSDIGNREASYEVLRLPFCTEDEIDAIMTMVDYSAMARLIYDWFEVDPPIELMLSDQA
jgi:hypothetical protein